MLIDDIDGAVDVPEYDIEDEEDTDDELTLPYTWWLFDEPDIDNALEEAGTSLYEMFESFEIEPVHIDEVDE